MTAVKVGVEVEIEVEVQVEVKVEVEVRLGAEVEVEVEVERCLKINLLLRLAVVRDNFQHVDGISCDSFQQHDEWR